MQAQCGHCGAMLDLSTSAGADHVMAHAPKGSGLERREKRQQARARRAERQAKYWMPPQIVTRGGRKVGA